MERVLAEVRVARVAAVKVVALVTMVLFPALRVREFAPPEVIVPAPAKPKEVGVTEIVSIEATPVRAPVVVTLSPVEEIDRVPVVLPIPTLLVPVPRAMSPLPLTVNVPDDWVYPVIPESAPCVVMSQVDVSIATVELLFPILVTPVPEVLILADPVA